MGWNAFWNGRTTIYVNDTHRRVHYEQVARDIVELLPAGDLRVLDYGCGEALRADIVAARCRHLVLSDAAETVRQGLARRYAPIAHVSIMSPSELRSLPDHSFDVIVVNSMLQYVKTTDLPALFAQWRRLLAEDGKLVLGDVIPRDVSALTDAAALMHFAYGKGFLAAAIAGLCKTFFSDYRQKRAVLGLLRFDEREIIDLLRAGGFDAARRSKNMGHNPARMTICATPAPHRASAQTEVAIASRELRAAVAADRPSRASADHAVALPTLHEAH